MAIHIIIDGYNMIRQSPELGVIDQEDIQKGREALIALLAAYKKVKGHSITVVFDGMDAPLLSSRQDRIKGIRIKFSRPGESADAVIKRMAARNKEKAVIVTSDRDIMNFSASQGAAVIASPEFEDRVLLARQAAAKGGDGVAEEETGWTPTTKKKGPRRRLSKKDRRSRIKAKKL
jgi:predicted RNA-binding protein with PIN domain